MDSLTTQTVQNVLTALDKGMIPWRRPWRADPNCGPHTNVLTRRRYCGVKQLILEMAARKLGLSSQWWGTPEEWWTLGGEIERGSGCGTQIMAHQQGGGITTERVINLDQVAGDFLTLRPGQPLKPDFAQADRLIKNSGARFRHVYGNQALYIYPRLLDEDAGDYIKFPLKEQFEAGPGGLEGYYDTAIHELGHWTETRLGWTGGEAEGELRAEMCAGFLVTELGLPTVESRQTQFPHADLLANHYKWLPAWKSLMTQDPSFLFLIAEEAAKACDFLLRFVRPVEARHEPCRRGSGSDQRPA